jgi:hypothetical protein
MRKIMTDKKDTNDFDFEDSNDFDFGDEVTAKDEPPIAVVPETNDFDFDFDDEPTTPVGENVIKRQNTITKQDIKAANNMRENIKKQNTITERDIKGSKEDDHYYNDFGISEPKQIWIRKIECTNLNELDQQIVRTLISFRDYTKSTQKFSNAIIQNEFANADHDGKTDFIVKKVCRHIVERKKMSIHVKHYYLAKFEEYLIEVFSQEAKQMFDKLVGEVKHEVKEGFDEMRKQIV